MTVIQQATSAGTPVLDAMRLITARLNAGAPPPRSVVGLAAGQAGPLTTIALDLVDLDAITTWAALLGHPGVWVTMQLHRATTVLHTVDVYLPGVRVHLTARTPVVPTTAAMLAEALIAS